MATFVKRGLKVRAIVRKLGKTLTKTFPSVGAAKLWAAQQEITITKREDCSGGLTLGDVLTKHLTEVVATKQYAIDQAHYKMHIRRLGSVELFEMDRDWWIKTIKGFNVSPGSAQRYVAEIFAALKRAQRDMDIKLDVDGFRRARATLLEDGVLAEGNTRDRRIEPDELKRIKAEITAGGTVLPMHDIIDIALLLGLRLGEICDLRFADINEVKRMIIVRQRKHPKKKMLNNQNVPLMGNSLEILLRQPRNGELIFPFATDSLGHQWREACKRAGVKNCHFHDLRHEAISRLFEEGFTIPEVCLVSGHKDWKNLAKYTNLKPEDMHLGPLAFRRRAA